MGFICVILSTGTMLGVVSAKIYRAIRALCTVGSGIQEHSTCRGSGAGVGIIIMPDSPMPCGDFLPSAICVVRRIWHTGGFLCLQMVCVRTMQADGVVQVVSNTVCVGVTSNGFCQRAN